jgi:hypothetical protein
MDDLWELNVQDLEWCDFLCLHAEKLGARWLKSFVRHDTDQHIEDELRTAKCKNGRRSLQTTVGNKKPMARHSMGFASWTQGRLLLFGGKKGETFGHWTTSVVVHCTEIISIIGCMSCVCCKFCDGSFQVMLLQRRLTTYGIWTRREFGRNGMT